MDNPYVILVDENDNAVGKMEKLKAHREGLLHRAYSVFVFNTDGQMLIQRRAHDKYHSPGLWTNACCSHPQPDETTRESAEKRLTREMGIQCSLDPLFSFTYQANLDNGLIEHELDHVFIGITDDMPSPNPQEADDWKYIPLAKLKDDIAKNPNGYTPWFKICLDEYAGEIRKYMEGI